jgi:hypothetical protein
MTGFKTSRYHIPNLKNSLGGKVPLRVFYSIQKLNLPFAVSVDALMDD